MKLEQIIEYLNEIDIFQFQENKLIQCGPIYVWKDMRNLLITISNHTNGDKYVDFIFAKKNLFASHRLEDLDLITLYKELEKILRTRLEFQVWSESEFPKHIRNEKLTKLGIWK